MEERGALLADVDERGLHAGQNARDFTEDDVAERASCARALEMELRDDAVLDERNARLAEVDVDDE
jgi:hypothetical protein